ncbi:MAG: hypothetical protein A3J07_01470 [Candidatus Doudnabacteria bacterium RIFCSPLOWO2_02_FULL_49_13]|nr:MAG: hypothetical protein A3J07_01470 [Candidatus Doudnabacteria bacterium RIFCSPLOWO2_02_FULL_49_13]
MKFLSRLLLRPPRLYGLPLGQAGEEWVCYLYRRRGFEIVARNYTVFAPRKLGEIDIVCWAGDRLILVEVKTRSSEQFMDMFEAVDRRKQEYLRRMAKLFLQKNPDFAEFPVQIDVAGVLLDPFDNSVQSVKLLENAVEDTD